MAVRIVIPIYAGCGPAAGSPSRFYCCYPASPGLFRKCRSVCAPQSGDCHQFPPLELAGCARFAHAELTSPYPAPFSSPRMRCFLLTRLTPSFRAQFAGNWLSVPGFAPRIHLKFVETMRPKRIDPLLCDLDLALSATFHPAGFPLRIATNSPHVLEAAAEYRAAFDRQFDTPAMEFRVVVEPAGDLAREPTFRKQLHLLSFVSDANNFATGDSRTLSATFHLSEATAANHLWLRWFYLESMAYMLLTQRYVVSLHAACVARDGAGILICGPSGCGKSTLSFACARAGFTYVSDDCTWLLLDSADRQAVGRPHQFRFRHDAARHFPELAGYVPIAHPNGKLSIEVPDRKSTRLNSSHLG